MALRHPAGAHTCGVSKCPGQIVYVLVEHMAEALKGVSACPAVAKHASHVELIARAQKLLHPPQWTTP